VIALIGVLAAIAVPNFKAARERSGPRAMMANMKSMMGDAEMAQLDQAGQGGTAASKPAAGLSAKDKAGVRVRSYFPETLYSNPALLTDDGGRARLELEMADSITTWRMTGLASSKAGDLGSFTAPIRVFQEFFVDVDLPVALTKGDEIALPVAVYNYLDRPQEVRLELDEGPWYSLAEPRTRSLTLAPGEVRSERFRITALRAGSHPLTVWGIGSARKDAVRREVRVVPRGKETATVTNGLLEGAWEGHAVVPAQSVDSMERLVLRLHPSAASQVVEGLDTLIRAPHG
jgi:uncharacterized protein YfaS (alpha-2-macroglobulin family)